MLSMKKLPLALLVGTLIFLASCSTTTSDQGSTSNVPSGTLSASTPLTYDWDKINIQGGKVSHTFEIQNTSEGPVQFSTATTSCMCTTASIALSSGKQSPEFGMHGNQPWGESLNPGETASITVTFDPMAHGPDATGPISRSVYVSTNAKPDGSLVTTSPDTKENVLTLKVAGNVLSEADFTGR